MQLRNYNYAFFAILSAALAGCTEGHDFEKKITSASGVISSVYDNREEPADEVAEAMKEEERTREMYSGLIEEVLHAAPQGAEFKVIIDRNPKGACGIAQEAHFCRVDRGIYINREFSDEVYRLYGLPAVRYIVAHEYGHAVNTIFGESEYSIVRELFSDCIAGYISGRYGGSMSLDDFVILAEFTHRLGSDSYERGGSHGYGQQRFSAFAWGLTFGRAERNGKIYADASCYYFTDGAS